MQKDDNIHLFAGDDSDLSGVSVHPLFGHYGGTRFTELLATPTKIEFSSRNGSGQGIDIRLSALETKAAHSYKFTFAGEVTGTQGTSNILFFNVVPSVGSELEGEPLMDEQPNADSSDGTFSFEYTLTYETIAAHNSAETAAYRLAGVSQRDFELSTLIITAICPSSCSGCSPLFDITPVTHTPFRNITATALIGEMGIGWNLGGTLDAHNDRDPANQPSNLRNFNNPAAVETAWLSGRQNRTTQELISAVKSAGFDSIRIPVTWYKAAENYTVNTSEYTIDQRWLNHVQSIVDMAVREDMYIILNTHHEEYLMRFDNAAAGTRAIRLLWTQIAEHFKDYNEKLIFEGLNEPRIRNTALFPWNAGLPQGYDSGAVWNWTGNSSGYITVNTWNQEFVSAVRDTGGNNANRILIVPTYAAQGTSSPIGAFMLPNDPGHGTSKLVMSVHFYSPVDWAKNATTTTYPGAGRITTDLTPSANRAAALGVPLIYGEWGSRAQQSHSGRVTHAYDYTRAVADLAARSGNPPIRTFVWDDAASDNAGFGIVNRTAPFVTPQAQQLIDAMRAGRNRQARP
ncbi:MAG: glycoside hydrolase family 5 protein [Oscillospiraceae bacterium]|nr:glycoside hydrolase family 5 protein [Oscillospiraceae bacterium]